METDALCQYLDWDSNFFGVRIARLTPNRLISDDLQRALAWCHSHDIDCIYFLADAGDADTVRLVEDNRFRFVDIRVTLEIQLRINRAGADSVIHGVIRACRPEDIPALRAIARVSHRDSRFYHDPNFPESLCDALYETWIEKSCHGYAEAVLVAELDQQAVGYISCHLPDPDEGQIGLFAIAGAAQGKGLGQRLVNESLCWFAEQGRKQVTVVTQGRNCKAQRLYQRCGFFAHSVQLWYHRWFSPGAAKATE